MSDIIKKASATWQGSIKEGKGTISTESGALDKQPFGFNTRFEGKAGTNPEEIIGAAHAGCFSMALSLQLGEKNATINNIDTQAAVTLSKRTDGFEVTKIKLVCKADLEGISDEDFQEVAKATKEGCPISKLFKGNAEIVLEAELV